MDSNGLSLPESHDMHLGWRDVLDCAAAASSEVHDGTHRSALQVLRLPGNLLEPRGLQVARDIADFFATGHASEDESGDDPHAAQAPQEQDLCQLRALFSVTVCVTRPLTAYPYGGTGVARHGSETASGTALVSTPPAFLQGGGVSDGTHIDAAHPIRILDYRIEVGAATGPAPAPLCWTNEHFHQHGLRPAAYQPILNAVLSHFDAEAILEASRERKLTMEERETLDGCKLLQGMLHDLDAGLDAMQSFAAYEDYLVKTVVPLIYGSFEGLDEESAGMLQVFFRVHGMAVRMVVTRWTRELLLADEGRSAAWTELGFGDFAGIEIPEDVTLQEFSLRHLLKDEAVQSLVLGCSQPEHVLEALKAAASTGGVDRNQ